MSYVVGIDLGTTHTALSSVDLDLVDGEHIDSADLAIPQLVSASSMESKSLLPSFLYLPHPAEGPCALPWDPARMYAVGELARSRGSDAPSRVIASSKSWLCHANVDRRAAILPWAGIGSAPEADLPRISPVEVSRRLLTHLIEAWDQQVAHGDVTQALSAQQIVLTVPASFDAAARDLTVEAAQQAGLVNLTLLEEPQAALYAWIGATKGGFRKMLRMGDVILVVDVGGGTTDFSAIHVEEQNGELSLRRVAVGEHILLGGDNMDLALAFGIKQKLAVGGKELDPFQTQALTFQARAAKELLLSRQDLDVAPIVIASRGSRLMGGTIRTELSRAELEQAIVEGFFPEVEVSARPLQRTRGGLQALGLNYAQDAAVTRHLAAFLSRQAGALGRVDGEFLRPTAILFNGGVMKAHALQQRVVKCLNNWLGSVGAAPVRVLAGANLDLSVARGAAYYGAAKQGRGVRIRGGTARAYYVGIEGAAPAIPGIEPPLTALCVAPFGMEEGTEASLPRHDIGLVVGEPVRFRFFGSTVRREDHVGQVLSRWTADELEELPAIEATIESGVRAMGEVVPVSLHASITEVGTLLLEAVGTDAKRHKIELNVREP